MNSMDTTLGFIGAGNMAEAILRGLINGKVLPPERIMIADPNAERIQLLQTLGVKPAATNEDLVRQSRILVLAVKPQVVAAVLKPISAVLRDDHLVISIAAGVATAAMDEYCAGKPALIRVMPNTPALVGRGVSALCAGPRATGDHLTIAERLFASVGKTVRVDESQMDAVTAISGSGPAYVFYWMEALLRAATGLGLSAETAKLLVYETLAGASELAAASIEPPEVLRARVTSKGGTTEAAIRTLEQRGVGEALEEAVKAAAARSRELSGR